MLKHLKELQTNDYIIFLQHLVGLSHSELTIETFVR